MIRQDCFKQTHRFFFFFLNVYNTDSRAKENLFVMPVQELKPKHQHAISFLSWWIKAPTKNGVENIDRQTEKQDTGNIIQLIWPLGNNIVEQGEPVTLIKVELKALCVYV